MAPRLVIAVLAATCVARPTVAGDLEMLKVDLQSLVDASALKYNCSFSVAIKAPSLGATLSVASGMGVTPESTFAFGSITKMWTAVNIMQLVARGELGLDEPAAPRVDAQLAAMKKSSAFPSMNFTRLRDLFGPRVETVTVRHLLSMQSGIPDFDTANPDDRTGKDVDPFRATVYAHPDREFYEPALLSAPWVAIKKLTFTPGEGFGYSSTNFGLLGLILAHQAGVADYRDFNQSSFIPDSLAGVANTISWAQRGSPRDHHVVPGFDRTDYNGQNATETGGVPVVDVHGVFSGWSASDFAGPTSAVAEIGYALYGNSSLLLPAAYRDAMLPRGRSFYGFGTMNVAFMGVTGNSGDFGEAYGHLGATYGYDSIFAYNPRLDMAIAVATNIETLSQGQPSEALCLVYNRVKNYLLGENPQECKFANSKWGGRCECSSNQGVVIV